MKHFQKNIIIITLLFIVSDTLVAGNKEEIFYIDKSNGVKSSITDLATRSSNFMLCASSFKERGQVANSQKSLQYFQILAFAGNETWSKTVFAEAVGTIAKQTVDKVSNSDIHNWCDKNIIPIVNPPQTTKVNNSFDPKLKRMLICAYLAPIALGGDVGDIVQKQHVKAASSIGFTKKQSAIAKNYLNKEIDAKIARYPSQVPASDLMSMLYASDFDCNSYK